MKIKLKKHSLNEWFSFLTIIEFLIIGISTVLSIFFFYSEEYMNRGLSSYLMDVVCTYVLTLLLIQWGSYGVYSIITFLFKIEKQ